MNALLAIFLFGILVFIHELGHFWVAKYCGVYVEKFAIGFGPNIWSKKIGDTEYALCLLPLGGYVKMRGEDMEAIQGKEEVPYEKADPRSYANQPVWNRIAIASMGPIFNFLLAIVIFTLFYVVGIQRVKAIVGKVETNSPAQQVGLIPGDEIIAVNDSEINTWEQLVELIRNNGDAVMRVSYQRGNEIYHSEMTPELKLRNNIYGEEKMLPTLGIDVVPPMLSIGIKDQERAQAYPFQTGDIIESINGQKVDYWWQVESMLKESDSEGQLSVRRREDLNKKGSLVELSLPAGITSLDDMGIEPGDLYIFEVLEGSPAAAAGLSSGDKIINVNGEALNEWSDFREKVLESEGESLSLQLMRSNTLVSVNITPETHEERDRLTNDKKTTPKLGVVSAALFSAPAMFRERTYNPFKALFRGVSETAKMSALTVTGLVKLITGKLPANAVGGPISIYYLAGNSYKAGGWHAFFRMMAMLSITLAVINLFPIPALDGGHIFIFGIEAIRGKPLPDKVIQYLMQAGVFLLLSLIIFVFYMDIKRHLLDKIWFVINQFLALFS